VTVLAHDLNNHLTPLQGRVELLRRRAVRDDRPQDLPDIMALRDAVIRLNSLVTDLLDVGRLEQSLFEMDRQPLDMATLLQETVRLLETPETPIELRLGAEPLALVLADPARIRQALENLLANATKHSPKGVAVTVELETVQREEGPRAVIAVHDTGPGVPAEIVPRLFSQFAAGPGSSGLGLGLYMARNIAEAHGGTLTYDPPAQGGATFRLELPLTPGDPPGPAEFAESRGAIDSEKAMEQRHHQPRYS